MLVRALSWKSRLGDPVGLAGRPGPQGAQGQEFRGAVEEETTGGLMATGADLGPQVLGGAVIEEDPDDRAPTRGTPLRQATQLVWRDQVLRDEPAEPQMVHLAEIRP